LSAGQQLQSTWNLQGLGTEHQIASAALSHLLAPLRRLLAYALQFQQALT
jgi:hypothetical protein